jgi:stress-induced-phosphoprotein 1
MFEQIFSGDIFTKLRSNPQTAAFLNQPDFVAKLTQIQQDPSKLQQNLMDQRIMASLGVLMGIPMGAEDMEMKDAEEEPPKPAPTPSKPKEEEKPKVELSDEQKKSEEEKNKGNEAYKNKKFEEALQHYTKSYEYDPKNITALTNRAGKK